MIIDVAYLNGTNTYISCVKNYDFYPETRMLFIECTNGEYFYVPITENIKSVMIENGAECGYLEGHDEAC